MPPSYAETDLIKNKDGSIYHLNLKPKDISDKIIVVGDPGRVHRVSQFFDSIDFEMNKREFITQTGKYQGKRITVISSGMGTGNIEILMHELDAIHNIDFEKREPRARKRKLQIIRVGTSGAIQEDLRIGTHLASEYAFGLDPLMHFYQYKQKGLEKQLAKKLKETLDLEYTPYCFKGSDTLLDKFRDCTVIGNTVTCPGFYAPQGREIRVPIQYKDMIKRLNYFNYEGVWLTNLEMETSGYYAFGKLLGHEVLSLNAILANRIRKTFSKNPNKTIDELIKKVLERI
ncbi:MAG: nucleoside phosphorylase [Bacteroidota bacterium]